jgi:recombination protein RecT
LELGETCYLVPFKGRCTFIADYKGLGQLMVAARAVRAIEMEAVREGDVFEYELGLDARLRHVPVWSANRKDLPVLAAYVILRLPNGQKTFKVMGAEEIDAIRQQYSHSWKSGPLPAWYACKTVLRQISKTMPKDERLARFYAALEADEEEDTVIAAEDVEHIEERPAHIDDDGVDHSAGNDELFPD